MRRPHIYSKQLLIHSSHFVIKNHNNSYANILYLHDLTSQNYTIEFLSLSQHTITHSFSFIMKLFVNDVTICSSVFFLCLMFNFCLLFLSTNCFKLFMNDSCFFHFLMFCFQCFMFFGILEAIKTRTLSWCRICESQLWSLLML